MPYGFLAGAFRATWLVFAILKAGYQFFFAATPPCLMKQKDGKRFSVAIFYGGSTVMSMSRSYGLMSGRPCAPIGTSGIPVPGSGGAGGAGIGTLIGGAPAPCPPGFCPVGRGTLICARAVPAASSEASAGMATAQSIRPGFTW